MDANAALRSSPDCRSLSEALVARRSRLCPKLSASFLCHDEVKTNSPVSHFVYESERARFFSPVEKRLVRQTRAQSVQSFTSSKREGRSEQKATIG